MRVLSLIRVTDTGHATFGRIEDEEHRVLCVTLERPWLGNQRSVSCIPAGRYLVKLRDSAKHHCTVYGIEDVPHRDDIELHWGDFARDTEGCVLLGTNYGKIDNESCILDSRAAFDRFMATMGGEDFTLDIMPAMEMAA